MSRKCSHCGVTILDNTEKCPLCNGILDAGENGVDRYPDIVHKARKLGVVLRILMAAWVAISAICGLVNYYTYDGVLWSAIVSISIFYVLFMLYLMTYTNVGYLGRIFASVIMGVVLVVSIDVVNGFAGWSVDYVLPGGLFAIDIAIMVVRFVNYKNWQSYMYTEFLVVLLGLIPIILINMGLVHHPRVSVAAVFTSVLLFIVTLIIGGRAARSELKRRFHI
ncbi:MAG: hypothetical protein K6B14_12245 [Lachnospiraceae bacterium]|nr:hypothetical protein [Lachnospiraceae bacterium]